MNRKQLIPVRSFKTDDYGTSLAIGPMYFRKPFVFKEPGKGILKFRVDQVSADTVPWDELEEISIDDRLETYRSAMEILTSVLGGSEFCSHIGVKEKEDVMYLYGRLGGEEASSNVFRVKVRNHDGAVVLKILPYSNYDTDPPDPNGEKSKQEVQFAHLASNAVLYGKTTYFPLVYGQGTCDEAILPRPSPTARERAQKLYDQARYWAISRAMIETYVPSYDRKAVVKWANGKGPEEVLDIIQANYGRGVTFRTEAPIRAELILMERAWGDLSMYLKQAETVGQEEMRKLILHCLHAINHLQIVLNIVHRDLVPENILIQKIRDKDGTVRPWPLITDFGDAVEFTGRGRRDEKLFDVKTFFNALRDKRTELTERIDVMYELIAYPSKYAARYGYELPRIDTMEDVIEYWKMKPTAFMEAFAIDDEYVTTMNKLEGNWGKEGDNRSARFLL